MPAWPFPPPVTPMEARVADDLPPAGDWAFEPKWDGFRAVAWSGEVRLDSRNQRPLLRYFPELEAPLRALPAGTVVDGEVVVVRDDRLDFDALQNRLHPAASRAARLARETPAGLVAFDLLAAGGDDLREAPFDERREKLVSLAAGLPPPWVLTPSTTDRDIAWGWFGEFEAAGCDGIVAKRRQGPYVEGKRAMIKVKHRRTVDCVVGGYRTTEAGDGVASILLGLHDGAGRLHFIGHCSGFPAGGRAPLLRRLEELRSADSFGVAGEVRRPGGGSRWSAGKDLSWVSVRPELVAEVSYDQLTGGRFRHATRFERWRPDKDPGACNLDQLERPAGPGFASMVG
jgi:ATP-dependent DNA ligase